MDGVSADKLNEKIQAKMKDTFIDLVPDDEWEALIQAAINKYTALNVPHENLTPLEKEVHQMLREDIRERVRDKLKQVTGVWWSGQGDVAVTDELQKIVEKAAPNMLLTMMQGVAQQTMQNINQSSVY